MKKSAAKKTSASKKPVNMASQVASKPVAKSAAKSNAKSVASASKPSAKPAQKSAQKMRPVATSESRLAPKVEAKTKSANLKGQPEIGPEILTQIKAQHNILKTSIKILKNQDAPEFERQRHLKQFIQVLTMHSEAEEATIYPALKKESDDSEKVILEANVEHDIAKSLVEELKAMDFETAWSNEIGAKAKVLAELVEHHAEEEEQEMFMEARKNFSKEELRDLGDQFAKFCEDFNSESSETAEVDEDEEEVELVRAGGKTKDNSKVLRGNH